MTVVRPIHRSDTKRHVVGCSYGTQPGFGPLSRHDSQIAERLDAEGFITGAGNRWTLVAVRNGRKIHRIPRTAASLPTGRPLPERRDDGAYSVLGAARHFGVSKDAIRFWIEKQLVPVSRHGDGSRAGLWLHVDQATERRLRRLANESRERTARRQRLKQMKRQAADSTGRRG